MFLYYKFCSYEYYIQKASVKDLTLIFKNPTFLTIPSQELEKTLYALTYMQSRN